MCLHCSLQVEGGMQGVASRPAVAWNINPAKCFMCTKRLQASASCMLLVFICGSLAAAQQADDIAIVQTPRELLRALRAGAEHVQIQQHLDLREEPGVPDPTGGGYTNKMAVLLSSTKSIRVRALSVARCRGLASFQLLLHMCDGAMSCGKLLHAFERGPTLGGSSLHRGIAVRCVHRSAVADPATSPEDRKLHARMTKAVDFCDLLCLVALTSHLMTRLHVSFRYVCGK